MRPLFKGFGGFLRGIITPGPILRAWRAYHARVAKLADAPDLGSGGVTRGGSTPPPRTNHLSVVNGIYHKGSMRSV